MNILLISANKLQIPYPVYPIGVSYLKTYLEKHLPLAKIHVFDYNFATEEELCELFQSIHFSYIGISLRNVDGSNSLDQSSFVSQYKTLVQKIRTLSTSPVIIGGAGFSVYTKSMFDILKPDYGIQGEGEEALRLLIEALETKQSPANIEGIVFYKGDEWIAKPHQNYLHSLDLHFEDSIIEYYWQKSGMLNIQTKRGCCYKCIYCSYPLIEGKKIRTLDPDLIVENLTRLYKEKNINYVFFTDSVFNIKNAYNAELAEKIIKSGIKIKWGAYFSPNNLTEEMIKLYKAAGLTHVEFGTESFSNIQLENYGKSFTFDQVLEKSELCFKYNVYYAHFLILAGYGETKETIKETIENSKKIPYSVYFPYIGMRVYPGTRLQEIGIANGKIAKDDNLLAPTYYIEDGFDLEETRAMALATGKSWIFPDDPESEMMDVIRNKRNKKGPIWEYLRKP